MKADIYYLRGQLNVAKAVAGLFREVLYKNVDVQYFEIDARYSRNSSSTMHELCRNYLRLLRASFLTSDPFAIVIRNDRETQWCYLGDDNQSPSGYCFELNHMNMPSLFPAVALLDRIVMLPEEIHAGLRAHPRTLLSLARPLEIGGVDLVDYSTESGRTQSVQRVAKQIKLELRSLCYRHMAVHGLYTPDFEELGRLLNVDSLMLESGDLFLPDVQLEVSVEKSRALVGAPSTVVLAIRNVGGRPLRNVRVRVRAPHNALTMPVSEILDIIPPNTARLEVGLCPVIAPYCPLELLFSHGDDPTLIPSMPIPVSIEVADPRHPDDHPGLR
jgi:hypothetical protein